jgi:hypothetical protein
MLSQIQYKQLSCSPVPKSSWQESGKRTVIKRILGTLKKWQTAIKITEENLKKFINCLLKILSAIRL